MCGAFLAAAVCHAQPLGFNRDIRPILSDRCLSCHGQDAANKGIRLRLDREESAKGPLKAIVPGKPGESLILKRIQSENQALRMPPVHTGLRVSAKEIATITQWISEGAPWQKHWSFIPPVKTEGSIDVFVRERLKKEGLRPSPAADPQTLLRRAALDITGLPPSPAEIDQFVNDRSPDAYEKQLDRLLASPRYAERMAIRWLDAARYADTNGYQTDAERFMWRWRDWVIEAFDKNMPFDRFITEQIAGDLIPNAKESQIIATGFSRNHRGNSEGGIVPEEYLAEYAVDRLETMGTVFLGLTVGCARCHNHKYDPITQKEFYQFFAYFDQIGDPGRYQKYGNSPPLIQAPTTAHRAEMSRLQSRAAAASQALAAAEGELSKAQSVWEKSLPAGTKWMLRESLRDEVPLTSLSFDGKTMHETADYGQFGFQNRFTVALRFNSQTGQGVLFHRMTGVQNYSEGYGVNLDNGHVEAHFAVRRLDDAILVRSKTPVAKGRSVHLAITYDGSRMASGVKMYVDGKPVELETQLDALNQDFRKPGKLNLGAGAGWPHGFQGTMAEFRSYNDVLDPNEVEMLALESGLDGIVRKSVVARTATESELARRAYLALAAEPRFKTLDAQARAARKALEAYNRDLPTVMVMQERENRGPTHILLRGAYDRPGEKVERGVLSALHPLPAGAPPNRLGLARWLTDRSNPLTARVAVNRFWQMIFGTGLVKTVEDFGAQGEWPSHPELLDSLAVEFMESGWDVKKLWKTILLSETYRQSSRVTPELRDKDPDNRLLARGPRVRLPAEMVRDQALAVSGLLVEKAGGPSVKPYQPGGLWTENGGADYAPDTGESLYRRSLYTFWRRTSPPPFMATFDSALRESCTVREGRTNTPLQALHLMNDTQFLEAARALAQRAIRETAAESRIDHMFRHVVGRQARAKERDVLRDMLAYARDRFRTNPADAAEFLRQGESARDTSIDPVEHAAWMSVASQILNLDAAVTKE
ncbi:MAG: DUF1553 domain-containing protein [Acidobacteria bacterium]|nr:DUF1553 domain-containing protein [Acidobacteriota bacterium]